jgi:hypothetical protein
MGTSGKRLVGWMSEPSSIGTAVRTPPRTRWPPVPSSRRHDGAVEPSRPRDRVGFALHGEAVRAGASASSTLRRH